MTRTRHHPRLPEPSVPPAPAARGYGVGMTGRADQQTVRVRPHVARAVRPARHVLLDFDGVMFDMRTALGSETRECAVMDLLHQREYRPRPLPVTFVWFGIGRTLAYLAHHEPDLATAAEAIMSDLEADAALRAHPANGLDGLLTATTATRRKVGVISDMSSATVREALDRHGLAGHVDTICGREGVDPPAFDAGHTVQRTAARFGVPPTECLVVSGWRERLRAAEQVGALGLGYECKRDRRKHLARADSGLATPVVSNLAILSRALMDRRR